MTCQKCSKDVPESAAVCPYCGTRVEKKADDQTGPVRKPDPEPPKISEPAPSRSGSKILFIIAGIALLAIIVVLVGHFAFNWQLGKKGAFPGVSQVGANAETNAKFENMQEMANNIDKLEQDMQQRGQEMARLQAEYQARGGTLKVGGIALTEDERKLLADLMKNEKSGYQDLLREILSKDKEIWDTKARLSSLEEQLPRPHVVKAGERHRDIAIHFLTEVQKLSRKQAEDLVDRINLLDPLLPGFKVWNFYINGAFGTYITQGTAPISPNEAEREKIQTIVDERNTAFAERDNLKTQVTDLEGQKTQLNEQITGLTQEKESLATNVEELKGVQANLESDVNSLYFRAGLKDDLEKSGIIKDPFLGKVRLENFKSEDFTGKIDLRSQTSIVMQAANFGMKKIKKAVILPSIFKEKIDYKITISADGQEATIEILNPDKFLFQKIVIALE